MQTVVQRVSLPAGRRILAVSDIHGGRVQLRRALDKAHFTPDDILFMVGDYIERGPDSLGVIREVMNLCQTHTVYPLIGNVDLWRLDSFVCEDLEGPRGLWDSSVRLRERRGQSLLWEMCAEVNLSPASPEELAEALPRLRAHFQPEIDFLRSLPAIIETDRYIFVHGGIPSEDLSSFAGADPYPFLKNDAFIQKGIAFDRWVVVGHWPSCLYGDKRVDYNPYVSESQHIIDIDGGCGVKDSGQVNVVVLAEEGGAPKGVYSADLLPTVTALDAQAEWESPALIVWTTRQVELLEQGEEFARIRHLHSGKEMWIPNCLLYEDDGEICAEDYAGNSLAVSPGEELSVILRTSRGILAKKKGIVGWYSGRYAEAAPSL